MKTKGVFFDLYGTLLIYGNMSVAWADWLEACYESLQHSGLTVTLEEFADYCDGLFTKPEPLSDEKQLTVYERRIKSLALDLQLPANDDVIRRAATASAATWQKHVTLDPEALPLLDRLRTTNALALISNFDHPPHLYELLDNLQLTKFFAPILISGETGFKKPQPQMFFQALGQTGLLPDEVIYVGDTADDINGATAAGIRPIYISRDQEPDERWISDYKSDRTTAKPTTDSPTTENVIKISRLSELIGLLN